MLPNPLLETLARIGGYPCEQLLGCPSHAFATSSLGNLPPCPSAIRDLPSVPDDWPTIYLNTRLGQLIRAVSGQIGPYGPDVEAAAQSWGVGGIMSEPLWFAPQLYSLITGEMLAKEHAALWYPGRRKDGALAEALTLILGWREHGEAPDTEIVRVAQLIQPGANEFLHQVVASLRITGESLPSGLPSALQWVKDKLDQM